MAPRPRCSTCGSRQWHKEPLGGLISCSEGHVLQNYRTETHEVDHTVEHVMNKRKLKSTSKRKERTSKANPQIYHGTRARFHYFVCQQYLLRLQVETLTKLWNLPLEFETVCRGVWSLHLSFLRPALSPEPYLYAQDQTSGVRPKPSGDLAQPAADSSTLPIIIEEETNLPNAGGVDLKDTGESEKSEFEDDSEMEELLRQNSEISSSSDEDDPGEPPQSPPKRRIDRRGKMRLIESPASTLAVIMVGLWQLRIPVMFRDLARIIESYELPYLDPVRLLPPNIVVHLTKHSTQALSPHHVPSTLSTYKLTARLARKMNSDYGVFTPECNAAPLLWRLTKTMGGTPTLYALAKRVAYILKLPLTLHSSLAPGLRRVDSRGPEHHKYDNVPPEVALMATIIIGLKMVYGLDGKPRYPDNAGDPALAFPRADQWFKWLKELDDSDAATKDTLFSSENALAVGDLNENLLDDYLGFCEHALLDAGYNSNDIIATNYFPVSPGTLKSNVTEVKLSRAPVSAGAMVDEVETNILRPAEDYTIWNSRDIFGSLAEDYETVLKRAAKWIRTGEDYLGGVVELYERRFVRWWEEEKRREKGESGSEEG